MIGVMYLKISIYINKNRTEKKNFLSELMFWLNSMDASYKITLCNEYQSVEKFVESIRNERNEKNIRTLQGNPAVAG